MITDPIFIKKIYEVILDSKKELLANLIADKVLYGDEFDEHELDKIDKESKVTWKEIYHSVYDLKELGYLKYGVKTRGPSSFKVTFKGIWHMHRLGNG